MKVINFEKEVDAALENEAVRGNPVELLKGSLYVAIKKFFKDGYDLKNLSQEDANEFAEIENDIKKIEKFVGVTLKESIR